MFNTKNYRNLTCQGYCVNHIEEFVIFTMANLRFKLSC